MSGLIFLDTETTGNNIYYDRLFEVAYKFRNKTYAQYFKPEVPISAKASSITHITSDMVEDKIPFSESKMKKDLSKILKENILVAHSAEFDIEILSKEGLEVPNYICTLKVARYLDENLEIPEYGLQYLRYFLNLDVKDAKSHDAKSDILVLEALFKNLYKKMEEKIKGRDKIIEKMIQVSREPVLFKIFTFGKHKGKKIEEVILYDKGYVEWMLEQKLQDDRVQEDWIFSLKYYLQIKD